MALRVSMPRRPMRLDCVPSSMRLSAPMGYALFNVAIQGVLIIG
jgi:hypothetical protein